VCLGEVDFEPEGTVIAQKILSCIARVGERFGVGHVSDVLRGQLTERVQALGHDKLSTFGLLNDHRERQLRDWISQLVSEDVLQQTTDQYPVLKLNDESWQVMKGRRPVALTRARAAAGSRKSRVEEVSWEGVDQTLFDALRNWRREVASRKGIPPFTIFHDSSLRDISRIRPTTLERLHWISGVGDVKLQEFGDEVLKIVARISRDKNLAMDNEAATSSVSETVRPKTVPAAEEESFAHFRQGKSIADVAILLGRAESTARDYLCMFIEAGRPESVHPWVDGHTQERIMEAARRHGTQRLKPVFLELNQEVPYDAIRIVLTFLSTGSQHSIT
jgi:ATP-dependent DNA helicase RecQ